MKIRIKADDITVRNPVAAELHNGAFRKRVVRDRTKYRRKQKHRKGEQ